MEIKLGGKGGTALVSPEDYELVSSYNWYLNKKGYAQTTINRIPVLMHRLIMKADESKQVDHINRNKLDNQRLNLRLLTSSDHSKSKCKSVLATSSKYKNVTFHKKNKKYQAAVKNNSKSVHIGYFENELDAAIAVDMYIVHNHLEYHNLNFPNDRDKYLSTEYKPHTREKKFKYIGITKERKNKYKITFRAQIIVNGKNTGIGSSTNEIECAKQYDKYIVDNNIPHKKLNFPEDYPNYNPNCEILTLCEDIDDSTVKLLIKNTNKNVIIDKNDYDKVKNYTCGINKEGYVVIYMNNKTIGLHKFLMNPGKGLIADHIDSDKCNNTRKNLRIITPKRNAQNKIKKENSSSKYIGVSAEKTGWATSVSFNGKVTKLGRLKNEEDAGRKRDLFILENYPDEVYKLNFKWTKEEIIEWRDKLGMSRLLR